ncbi:DUF1905 domain-containing protein, partial [Dysosmobacter welbionis]
HRGAGLRRGDHLHLSHQGTEPLRPDRAGRHHLRRLYLGAPAGRGGGGPAVLHGPGLSEDGDAGPLPGHPTGCAGLYPGVLLRRHRSRPQT